MAKAEKVTNLGVAKVETVSEGISFIVEQINKLKHIQETPYKTPGKITMGGSVVVDIKETKEIDTLVKAYSVVATKINAASAAYEKLGFTTYKQPKVDGGTIDEWTDDVKLRLEVIQFTKKLEKLQKTKKAYEDLMDKEDKLNLLNKQVEKMMNDEGDLDD